MTEQERRESVRQFVNRWNKRGREDEDDRSYWIEFLHDILGVEDATHRMEFQKKVLNEKGTLSNRIDVYIPETKVIIEQKTLGIPLDKPQPNHGNKTPYEQAKEYDNALPTSEKANWIITSNFEEIWVYYMDTPKPEPVKYNLIELRDKYSDFEFLINQKQKKISRELEVSVKAGEFVGLIYDALYKQYKNPDEESLKSLNMLCVRLVFCLYAEDAHVFGSNGRMFHDYLDQFETKDMRRALIDLFKVLDQNPEKGERDKYIDDTLAAFPYVNGGLFADEDIEIPPFTEEIREILLDKASEGFDWSQISPTIFGAVFESTLNPETRRSGGMHYTSIENIHKVIDPLFLDDLKAEFEEINSIQVEKTKKPKLEKFQEKLAALTWFDPACGSGNFLTETYISIRRLENQVIREILDCDRKQVDGQIVFGVALNPIKVGIDQFYGIEINDFAVTVAKTALWIAESQMMKETEDMIHMSLDFLPLKTNAYIHEGNALRVNWEDIVPKHRLNYIMGNPPFVANNGRTKSNESHSKGMQSEEQKKDRLALFGKEGGVLDYVACWYKVAATYMSGTKIQAAFVATDSICQGQQLIPLWKPLFDMGIIINFAYEFFKWESEASGSATVYVVIVGFGYDERKDKYIFYKDGEKRKVSHINAYLIEAEDIFIDKRKEPICNVSKMIRGSQPTDGGNFILTAKEKDELIKKEPQSAKYIHPFRMGEDMIKGIDRYCLWLLDCDPQELKNMPLVLDRVKKVRELRLNSTKAQTVKKAETPMLFDEIKQPDSNYLAYPIISAPRRIVPVCYYDKNIIAGNKLFVIPDASLYEFGVITSNVHMAWMRATCSWYGPSYQYSNTIVYNNFPWPNPTAEQKAEIEKTAQGILNARKNYCNSTLEDLYGENYILYKELVDAHVANDKAVMKAYGFSIKDTSEADCVAALMKMYQELTQEKGEK